MTFLNNTLGDKNPLFLSIIIPCYNEEKVIGDTLREVNRYLRSQNYPFEIIVVDDGSRDNTLSVIKEIAKEIREIKVLEGKENKGKGYSVRRGLLHAKGLFACFTDADLSTPIEEVEKLLKELDGGYDIAIGSRGLKESEIQIHQPLYRERMGKIFNLLIQLFALKGIKDTQCGFKCFKKEVIDEVFSRQSIYGFSFDVEVLYIARKLGYKIKEVPIRWYNNPHSKVNPFVDPVKMLIDLLRVRINDWRGRY